jgi:hypothetical protein
VLAVLGGHVGVAGADVLVAGGARRDAAAALAAGVARPQAHLGTPGLAAPVRAARAAVWTQPMQFHRDRGHIYKDTIYGDRRELRKGEEEFHDLPMA